MKVDAHILYNVCWCICGLSYFFVFTTIIHFCCSSWLDERVPMNKDSKKWLYFISAHMLRVINLCIAIADMTFEQLSDIITTNNKRVLSSNVTCDVSSRVRMSLFLSSFYTYALFCWYKVAIVTMQEPERHSPHIPKTRIKKKKKQVIIREQHPFLDLLWFYIHLIYIVSMICGNIMISPANRSDKSCEHQDNLNLLIAYMIAVLIEFIALIIIFVSPLYQLMKTKKRLFRNVFSNINIKVRRDKNENTKKSMLLGNNMMRMSSNESNQSPAQQEFISRIKSTICRNFVSGSISIVLFSGFMFLYTFGRISGYKQFFTSGIGYVVVFACYLLNYLCLTFSYQNHWPMILPLICNPSWSDATIYHGSKISLQQQQQQQQQLQLQQDDIAPFILNDEKIIQAQSASIPIMTNAHNQRGDPSFESLLASSHLSATPKYHTLNFSDNVRIQKQYDEYLKKQKIMTQNIDVTDSNNSNSMHNINENENETKVPPSSMKQKNQIKVNQYHDEAETEDSSVEYDSEGIDSIQLRTANYDSVEYHHDK